MAAALPRLVFGEKNMLLSSGVTVIDEIQLSVSEMRITQKSELQYSPVLSFESPIAAKAITPIAVAPKSDHWFSRPLRGRLPSCRGPPRCRP